MVYVLYHTNVVAVYFALPPFVWLNRFTKIREYHNSVANGCQLEYSQYMLAFHNGFFVQLFACVSCLTFWMALATVVFAQAIVWLPVVYLGSIAIAKLANRIFIFLDSV